MHSAHCGIHNRAQHTQQNMSERRNSVAFELDASVTNGSEIERQNNNNSRTEADDTGLQNKTLLLKTRDEAIKAWGSRAKKYDGLKFAFYSINK